MAIKSIRKKMVTRMPSTNDIKKYSAITVIKPFNGRYIPFRPESPYIVVHLGRMNAGNYAASAVFRLNDPARNLLLGEHSQTLCLGLPRSVFLA